MAISSGEVTQQEALLTTKLSIPQARTDSVPRGRLIDQLNEGFDRKLTLVSAPPGSGKTTLLAEWSARSEKPVAWLSLDKGDNELRRFFAHFLGALQGIDPGIEGQALAFLQAAQPQSAQVVLVGLINEIQIGWRDPGDLGRWPAVGVESQTNIRRCFCLLHSTASGGRKRPGNQFVSLRPGLQRGRYGLHGPDLGGAYCCCISIGRHSLCAWCLLRVCGHYGSVNAGRFTAGGCFRRNSLNPDEGRHSQDQAGRELRFDLGWDIQHIHRDQPSRVSKLVFFKGLGTAALAIRRL